MKNLLFISLFVSIGVSNAMSEDLITALGHMKSKEDDQEKIEIAKARCQNIASYIVKNAFEVECFTNYNHYGPTTKSQVLASNPIKIANYNLLHPGTSKSLYKDYSLVAKIMNRYDIISGLELLPTVGRDEVHNKAVLQFLEEGPAQLLKLKSEKLKITAPAKIEEIEVKIAKLSSDLKKARTLLRAPGYLNILGELKKLDPSWSLILSPRGDAAASGSVEELTGFYYRANMATPTLNPHCNEMRDVGAGAAVACFINLEKRFMGKSVVEHFSRRPFMASFKVGTQKITLVTSHVVFTYSGDEAATKDFMMKTFGVENYKDLGVVGINSANFARYAEVKNTLDFMNRFRKRYNDNKIIFLADMNLVSNNNFWPEVLKAFPGGELLVKDPSTISPTRYSGSGVSTEGVANDYDHFILEKSQFPGCSNGEVYNYFKESIFKDIQSRYGIKDGSAHNKKLPNKDNDVEIRNEKTDSLNGDILPTDDGEVTKLDYPLTSSAEAKMNHFASVFEKYLKNLLTVRRNEVVEEDFQMIERVEGLKRRVFLRQLTNPFYYRYMQEVISDHFPASITCKF